ncbi:MAG: hemolysin family protein [Candidatus Dormibacteraeota bacterium]|nr:hemolysin family protein [Candidatus Dormibacteraeota bacterium]
MNTQNGVELFILVVCVFLAALASGTETALTSVNRLRVRHLAEDGSQRAATLQRLQQDPQRFLGTVLIVNTFSLIIASAAATLLGLDLLDPVLPKGLGTVGDFVVSFALSLFLLIFAEITPKTLAVRHADRVALQVAPAVDRLATIFAPVLWFVTSVARVLVPGRGHIRAFVTEAELMTLLSVSEEQGIIEEEERDMIQGIVEIGDKLVREVMVPRPDIVAVEKGVSAEEIAQLMETKGHTRIPVYDKDFDHIIGLVHAKDLLRQFVGRKDAFRLERIIRPILQIPEQKKVDELLHEMRLKKAHMMVVIDEYGGTAGIVTLEDVLEEIVGEIRDEYDLSEKEPFEIISANEAVVDGGYSMDELNDQLDLGIAESDEYDSVGGYLNSVFGAIPKEGATFDQEPIHWKVEEMNGSRIVRVRITTEDHWPHDVLLEAGIKPPDDSHERRTRVEDEFA